MDRRRCVLVVCDSLRNDLLGPDTPTLNDIARHGTRFTQARGVFPSTTRVSAASIATGCLPQRHGLLGNTMLLREPQGLTARSAGHPDFRARMRTATGTDLRVPVLAERLGDHCTSVIYSNVSPGAAYFFDPRHHGYVYHRAGSYAPGGRPLTGSEGLDIAAGADGDREMTRRFCAHLQADADIGLAVLWLSEPDTTGHATPLGSAAHRAAIRQADACVATVAEQVATLRQAGEDILFLVCSDHGMETISQPVDIAQALVDAGLKAAPDSHEIVVAPNGTAAILGHDERYALREPLLHWLAAQPWVGELAAGDALAAWGLPDEPACRVALSLAGDDTPNTAGVPGSAWYALDPAHPKDYTGRGQHGGRHAHEQHPFLIIDGRGFTPGLSLDTPVRLIDYAPTLLHHLAVECDGMQGHALQRLPTLAGAHHPLSRG